MSGFKTAVQENVQVVTTQTVTADFKLEVGDLQDQITVSSSAAILEKVTSEIGTAATELEVHTWPILVGDGTRQLQNFIFRPCPERKEAPGKVRSTAASHLHTRF